MPPRPTYASTFLTLIAVASLFFTACSSSRPRDQWYGTDAGLGFVPQDDAAVSSHDLAPDGDGVSADLADTSADLADTADGDLAIDADIAEGG
jgi:hypothetical protein